MLLLLGDEGGRQRTLLCCCPEDRGGGFWEELRGVLALLEGGNEYQRTGHLLDSQGCFRIHRVDSMRSNLDAKPNLQHWIHRCQRLPSTDTSESIRQSPLRFRPDRWNTSSTPSCLQVEAVGRPLMRYRPAAGTWFAHLSETNSTTRPCSFARLHFQYTGHLLPLHQSRV